MKSRATLTEFKTDRPFQRRWISWESSETNGIFYNKYMDLICPLRSGWEETGVLPKSKLLISLIASLKITICHSEFFSKRSTWFFSLDKSPSVWTSLPNKHQLSSLMSPNWSSFNRPLRPKLSLPKYWGSISSKQTTMGWMTYFSFSSKVSIKNLWNHSQILLQSQKLANYHLKANRWKGRKSINPRPKSQWYPRVSANQSNQAANKKVAHLL